MLAAVRLPWLPTDRKMIRRIGMFVEARAVDEITHLSREIFIGQMTEKLRKLSDACRLVLTCCIPPHAGCMLLCDWNMYEWCKDLVAFPF